MVGRTSVICSKSTNHLKRVAVTATSMMASITFKSKHEFGARKVWFILKSIHKTVHPNKRFALLCILSGLCYFKCYRLPFSNWCGPSFFNEVFTIFCCCQKFKPIKATKCVFFAKITKKLTFNYNGWTLYVCENKDKVSPYFEIMKAHVFLVTMAIGLLHALQIRKYLVINYIDAKYLYVFIKCCVNIFFVK